jgi:hypothetical protein
MTTELLQDYLNSYMNNKEVNVSEYIEDENDKTILFVRYSFRYKDDSRFGGYNEMETVSLIEVMGFMYSKIKKDGFNG